MSTDDQHLHLGLSDEEPTVQPAVLNPVAPVDLLESTRDAFSRAAKGLLSIIDLFNAAQSLTDAQQPEMAIQLYRLWLTGTRSSLAYAAQFNLAVLLENAADPIGAEAAYRLAIKQKLDFIEAHINLNNLLERTGRSDEALTMWRAALGSVNLDADNANQSFSIQALNHLGRLLESRHELLEAEVMFTRSLTLDPKQTTIMAHWVHLRQKQCEWPAVRSETDIKITDMIEVTSVMEMFGIDDDPAIWLAKACRYVDQHVIRDVRYLSSKHPYGHDRLRVGYLLSGICASVLSTPTDELYGLHDRSQVEVFGFGWSPEDGVPSCAHAISGMDHHFPIDGLTDDEAAHLIRLHEIDVLVDLNGINPGARPNILSYRPAPVQIAWPGFPGSTALPEIDFVIADPFVLPPELESFFTEKPLHMSHSFRIHDRQRCIGSCPSKESCGLPDDRFIFCCFNDNRAFTPEIFDAWMRILMRVPDSILWLIADDEQMRERLRRQASGLGVNPDRLFFANRVSSADKLACLQLADLFLDTFPFSADATISDALWTSLPVLTCAGRTFASRITGSLLKAVNLPELITDTIADYEEKAVNLALDHAGIARMKKQLTENRLTCSLFDTQQFVRDLETRLHRLVDDLPAPPPRPSQGANLDYLRPPGVVPESGKTFRIPDRRYVIAAPPFEHHSAGIRVLYELQKWLVCAGIDAIVCTWFPGYPVEQFADDIVIYPEVAPGNLLKAKRVIRYLMNVPGKLGYGEKQYDRNEVLVAYSKDLAHYSNGVILQVPVVEPFFRQDDTPKTVNAVYVGKGLDLNLHPSDCIYITKSFPPTRREVAHFLRRVKTLYMYDVFSMLGYEAKLCGCVIKLISKDGKISDYPFSHVPSIHEFKIQLHDFIEMTGNL